MIRPLSSLLRRLFSLLIIIALTVAWTVSATAQSCTDDDPDIVLTMTDLGISTVEIFYLADFDPSDGSLHPLLFQFSAANTGDDLRQLVLRFEVNSEDAQLLEGVSDPFNLAAGEVKSATNQELSDDNSDFDLNTMSISDAGEELKDVVLEVGYLPEGEYTFVLALVDVATTEQVSICYLSFHVSNPRSIDLIFPGGSFGGALPITLTTLPQFQWQSDAVNFNFRLCPVLPGDASGEEVMENAPVYENLDFVTGFLNTHTFLCPLSAEAFVPDESYCWQIEALVPTSGGGVVFYSDILCFQVGAGMFDELIASLPINLPPGVLASILSLLQDYQATGNVTLDGVAISATELQGLLDNLLAEGWEIGEARFE